MSNNIARFGISLIVFLTLLLSGCGGGGGDSLNSSSNPNIGAGWVRIDSAWADLQNAYMSGTAFISPTGWSCCSGTAEDTGVSVGWTNSAAGASGQASQYVTYDCLFSTCWPGTNRWYATIPLISGSNQISIIASDASGNTGRAFFSMTPGKIYPAIISTYPADDAINIRADTSVSATFSDNIDPASINSATFQVYDSNYVHVIGTYNVVGKTVTFVPSAVLAPYSNYYVSISAKVKNFQGNPMLGSYRWRFETDALLDTIPPTVSSVVPSAGSGNISVATCVVAIFSKAMNPGTINTNTFTVRDASNNPVSGTVNYSGNTARFTPTIPLTSSVTYTATITTGAKDVAGNGLSSDYLWNFTPGTQEGALDPSFGTGGIVTKNLFGSAHFLAADGTYLYVVGNSIAGPIEKRNLSDGVLVSGFGTNGVVSTAWNTSPRAVAIDSSYMYMVGLDASVSSIYQWRIEKRNLSDGALVTGFGNNGVIASVQSTTAFTEPRGIAIDSTYMYVVGYETNPSTKKWRIEKRNLSDGSLVASFGVNGVISSAQSSTYPVTELAISIDSTAMYVAGPCSGGSQIEKRNLSDGALDVAFGTSGIVTVSYYASNNIVTDGISMYLSCGSRLEKRSLNDGALILSFGSNGELTTSPGIYVSALAVDSTSLYLGGYGVYVGYEWRIEKRNLNDGALVPTFGTAGAVFSNPASQIDFGAILTDATSLYLGGNGVTSSTWEWRIEKRSK